MADNVKRALQFIDDLHRKIGRRRGVLDVLTDDHEFIAAKACNGIGALGNRLDPG